MIAILTSLFLAQSTCGNRVEIIRVIAARYEEFPRALGVGGGNILVELFTSTKGSWTLLATNPQGITCILATGKSWQEITQGGNL